MLGMSSLAPTNQDLISKSVMLWKCANFWWLKVHVWFFVHWFPMITVIQKLVIVVQKSVDFVKSVARTSVFSLGTNLTDNIFYITAKASTQWSLGMSSIWFTEVYLIKHWFFWPKTTLFFEETKSANNSFLDQTKQISEASLVNNFDGGEMKSNDGLLRVGTGTKFHQN